MSIFVDYYALLGVDPDASAETIKAAFKKLALQYHPDLYKGADAHERMSALLQAYQTLNDAEERKNYDRRYAEHVLDGPHGHPRTSAQPASTRPTSASASAPAFPPARRDRNRAYAFPDIREGTPVSIDLHDIHYHLAAAEAERLRQQGLLRGNAAKTDEASCYCHRCHHSWTEETAACPKCHASDWSEYLLLRCVHCCAVFESEQIRYEVGTYVYGKGGLSNRDGRGSRDKGTLEELCPPYELFPLCPYCATARWCPAEDARVMALRQRTEQRAAARRMIWMSVLVIALIILGVVVFSVIQIIH